MAHFVPVQRNITAMETAEAVMRNVIKIHRLPDKIISDRGSQFAASVIQELYTKMNVKVALSSAYHPQTDGQTERVNQDMETYLRIFCSHRKDDWVKWLHLAEFAYNNRPHSTTKISPFMANNLSQPKWSIDQSTEHMTHPAAQELLQEMKSVEDELKACLNLAADRMKDLYNAGDIPTFAIGDKVFLDARNIKEKIQTKDEPTRAMIKKLRAKRIGPYTILERIGKLNY